MSDVQILSIITSDGPALGCPMYTNIYYLRQTVLHYDVWHTHIFVIYERTSDVRMINFYQCRAVCHEGPIKFLLRRTVRRLNVRCVNVWRPNVIKCYASQRRTVLHTVMVISVNVIIIFITSLRHRTPSSCQISERVT